MVQVSHPYTITGKTIVLTISTFVGKVMALLCLLGHSFSSKEQVGFNFMAAVTICSDFGAHKNEVSVSIILPSICHEVMGLEDFPGGSDGKASAYNAGDPSSIPGSGRSPGEGNGNPL